MLRLVLLNYDGSINAYQDKRTHLYTSPEVDYVSIKELRLAPTNNAQVLDNTTPESTLPIQVLNQ